MRARMQRWEGRVGGWAGGVLEFYQRGVYMRELLQTPPLIRSNKLEALLAPD